MKRKFNFIVLPYRDRYFLESYGPIVRDLQILAALSGCSSVSEIVAINRPVSIYERIALRKPPAVGRNFYPGLNKIRWIDTTSLDIIGPLAGRSWTRNCYGPVLARTAIDVFTDVDAIRVLLDFTPIAKIDYSLFGADVIWYDLIDNFTKHNRFSLMQRSLVADKYRSIEKLANYITAVSSGASLAINNSEVVPNGVGVSRNKKYETSRHVLNVEIFDFGFTGFITDKFDIDAVVSIAALGYSVAIYGAAYDKVILSKLKRFKNIKLMGSFHGSELPRIISTFHVGLIPYRRKMSHDESPLKLYQYLYNGKPVLTSMPYEIKADCIQVYDIKSAPITTDVCNHLIALSRSNEESEAIKSIITDDKFWDYRLNNILKEIEGRFPAGRRSIGIQS